MDDRIYEDNEQLRAYRKNEELKVYRKYCDNLCLDNLCVLSVDDYYESLKDRSKFKEPRDTSKRDAKRDAQITFKSRFRCFFLKDETECKKREKEKQLQSEYKQRHQEDVNRKRAEFEENQRQNHKLMDEMKSKYIKGDKEQIINFFNKVLQSDCFTIGMGNGYYYDADSEVSQYDETTKTLSYEYRIPNARDICVIDEYIYDEKRNAVIPKEFDTVHAQKVRMNFLETLLLRSVARVIDSDTYNHVEFINLTGFLEYFDSAYGNYRKVNVVQLIISRDLWSQINLEYANKSELFERVLKENFKTSAGLYEKEPFDLAEIK